MYINKTVTIPCNPSKESSPRPVATRMPQKTLSRGRALFLRIVSETNQRDFHCNPYGSLPTASIIADVIESEEKIAPQPL